MDFDPDAYLKEKASTATVEPPAGQAAAFDPDAYLREKGAPAAGPRSTQTTTSPAGSPEYLNFVKANTRAGVPFDTTTLLPASTRARVSVESDLDKQLDLLKRQQGIEDARLSTDKKHIIATIKDPNGAMRDVLLNPSTGVNIAGNAASIGKVAAATGLAAATGGASLLPTAFIMGGGTAAVDALSKETSRLESGMELDPKNIAKSAAIEGGVNAALPVAGVLGKKVLSSVFRTGAGALEGQAAEAAARQGVPLTPAQATGSAVLARSTKLPGTGGTALATEQKGALKAATDRQLGLSGANAVPTEAEIAGRAQPVLAANAQAAQAGADTVLKDSATAAQKEITTQLDKGLVPTNATISDTGAVIRQKVESLRDAFQQQAAKNYGATYDIAAKEKLLVPTEPITKLAAEISAKDPQGLIQQLVPEVGRIFKLSAQAESPVATGVSGLSLPQAVELRAIVNDKITRGEAVGDIPGRYLKKLAGALTDAIETGVKSGSPELQLAYNDAKAAYAKDIGKFTSADIGKLFADADSGRHLGDSEIVPALFRGRGNLDALQAYRDVLGADSADYKLLLRQGLNHLIDEAGTSGGLLNADKFLTRLNGLSKEMRSEVLGSSADAIANNARIMASARGVKIDPADLETALKAAPGEAPKLFEAAVARQEAVDQAYNSGIMKQLRAGTLDPRNIAANPDEFVTRFVDNASTADVKRVLAQLGDKTNEMIRQRTLANVLSDVRAKPMVGQATTGENISINSDKLVQEYLTGPERAKYEAILGKDGIQFLDDVASIQEAMAKEALQAQGSALTPANRAAHLAGDVVPGERGLVRTGVRALTLAPEFAIGNAQRSAAVRQFLKTGELPNFNPVARGAVLAAPEVIKERRRALEQQAPEK